MYLDSGIFQCVASNPAGNIQAAAHLTIIKPGNIYQFSSDLCVTSYAYMLCSVFIGLCVVWYYYLLFKHE